jgi:hypothetical protein
VNRESDPAGRSPAQSMTSRSEVLLFSIISLTEQRDQLSLEVSLFQACQEIFRPETLAALEWRTDEGSFHVIHENPLSGAIPETVMAAARRMAFDLQHLGDGAGGEYLLLRIEAMAENTRRRAGAGHAPSGTPKRICAWRGACCASIRTSSAC